MLKYFFPKTSRLLRSQDFRLCVKHGIERSGHLLHIQIRKVPSSSSKLGLTVSRRYGNAAKRNRFKRLVREAFRLIQHKLPPTIHLNVRPRKDAENATFKEIQEELISLIEIK